MPPVAEADELAQLVSRAPHFGREVAVLGAFPVLHAQQRPPSFLAPGRARVEPRRASRGVERILELGSKLVGVLFHAFLLDDMKKFHRGQ